MQSLTLFTYYFFYFSCNDLFFFLGLVSLAHAPILSHSSPISISDQIFCKCTIYAFFDYLLFFNHLIYIIYILSHLIKAYQMKRKARKIFNLEWNNNGRQEKVYTQNWLVEKIHFFNLFFEVMPLIYI